ncbi:hypothetical protein AKO1_002701 [Acrasis kona]|uniref:Uncharacterized protein n=1 Tax=Acrasis kona TaxID=1008807 RepID=A0AAW2ZQP8_9EUKA
MIRANRSLLSIGNNTCKRQYSYILDSFLKYTSPLAKDVRSVQKENKKKLFLPHEALEKGNVIIKQLGDKKNKAKTYFNQARSTNSLDDKLRYVRKTLDHVDDCLRLSKKLVHLDLASNDNKPIAERARHLGELMSSENPDVVLQPYKLYRIAMDCLRNARLEMKFLRDFVLLNCTQDFQKNKKMWLLYSNRANPYRGKDVELRLTVRLGELCTDTGIESLMSFSRTIIEDSLLAKAYLPFDDPRERDEGFHIVSVERDTIQGYHYEEHHSQINSQQTEQKEQTEQVENVEESDFVQELTEATLRRNESTNALAAHGLLLVAIYHNTVGNVAAMMSNLRRVAYWTEPDKTDPIDPYMQMVLKKLDHLAQNEIKIV